MPWAAADGSSRRAELSIVEPTTSVEHASVVDLLAALATLRAGRGGDSSPVTDADSSARRGSGDSSGSGAAVRGVRAGRLGQPREPSEVVAQPTAGGGEQSERAVLEAGTLAAALLYLLLAHRLRLPATVVETEAGELVLEILPGTLERGVHILPPPLPAGASERAVAAAAAPLYIWLMRGERFGREMTEAEIGDLVGRDRAELGEVAISSAELRDLVERDRGEVSEVGLEIGEIVRRLQGLPPPGEADADGAAAAAPSADALSQATVEFRELHPLEFLGRLAAQWREG